MHTIGILLRDRIQKVSAFLPVSSCVFKIFVPSHVAQCFFIENHPGIFMHSLKNVAILTKFFVYVKKIMKPAKKNWSCIAQDFNRVLSILSYFIFNRISIYFLLINFLLVWDQIYVNAIFLMLSKAIENGIFCLKFHHRQYALNLI